MKLRLLISREIAVGGKKLKKLWDSDFESISTYCVFLHILFNISSSCGTQGFLSWDLLRIHSFGHLFICWYLGVPFFRQAPNKYLKFIKKETSCHLDVMLRWILIWPVPQHFTALPALPSLPQCDYTQSRNGNVHPGSWLSWRLCLAFPRFVSSATCLSQFFSIDQKTLLLFVVKAVQILLIWVWEKTLKRRGYHSSF